MAVHFETHVTTMAVRRELDRNDVHIPTLGWMALVTKTSIDAVKRLSAARNDVETQVIMAESADEENGRRRAKKYDGHKGALSTKSTSPTCRE
jgi:hypothetical protein